MGGGKSGAGQSSPAFQGGTMMPPVNPMQAPTPIPPPDDWYQKFLLRHKLQEMQDKGFDPSQWMGGNSA